MFEFAAEELDDPPLEGAQSYGRQLLTETVGHREWAEKLIVSKLENWELDRVTFLDRLILELALSEMVSMDDVPAKVSISEAIEIAKIYSTDDSPSFVNGILDAVYHDILDDKLELPNTK